MSLRKIAKALDTGPGAPDGPVAQAINHAPANEYPRIHAARAEIMSGTGEERFAWSIDVLVRDILSRAQQPQASRPLAGATEFTLALDATTSQTSTDGREVSAP
jgi:hypothetical protein